MSLRVALQMDAIESVNPLADSTYALGLEAQNRGYSLFHYHPDNLSWSQDGTVVKGESIRILHNQKPFVHLEKQETRNLSDFDVVLMRQDPPFNMHYTTVTHLLEKVSEKTLVLNNPFWVRNSPEKLLIMDFPQLIPPTLITRNKDAVLEFRTTHKDIIIKPLYGNGGAGVFLLREGDSNLSALFEMFTQTWPEAFMVQQFLPDVVKGDKRIILVDGEPIGAINRVPNQGETRSNMHVGGRPEPCDLTQRDLEICKTIGATLKERGLLFVGIDVIGDYLTEINVTSPTGLQELSRFNGINAAGMVWDAIVARVK
jgi:glutathione synthase